MDHSLPIRHLRRCQIQFQLIENDLVEPFTLHHQRHFIDRIRRPIFNHRRFVDIAKQRDLLLHFERDFLFRPTDENIRLNSDRAEFFDRVLSRFCFQFAGGGNVRQKRDVNVKRIVFADFFFDLPNRLEERQRLDIADRAADFRYDNVRLIELGNRIHALFDLVGDVRNDLHRRAEIIALAFFRQHRPIDFARRRVGILRKIDVDETFVMPEIEIGFRAVFGYENFTVLIRAHCSGIDVDVRIEFLNCHFDAATFEEPPE